MQSIYEVASRFESKTFPTLWIKSKVSVTPLSLRDKVPQTEGMDYLASFVSFFLHLSVLAFILLTKFISKCRISAI